MPSFKSKCIQLAVRWMLSDTWKTPEALRRGVAKDRKHSHDPPSEVKERVNIERSDASDTYGFPIYNLTPKSGTTLKARILYLHGGGFMFDVAEQHWYIASNLANRLDAVVSVAVYPLGPETKLFSIYDQVQPLYDDMAAAKEPTPFFVVGDSAGAIMSLVLSQQALLASRPLAAKLVPITPCCDMSLSSPDVIAAAKRDPWLSITGMQEMCRLICPDEDPRHPRVSPLFSELAGLPPMLVFAAEKELIGPDTIKFVDKVREKGGDAELVYGKGMIHVWPILPIPEATEAQDRIVKFLQA